LVLVFRFQLCCRSAKLAVVVAFLRCCLSKPMLGYYAAVTVIRGYAALWLFNSRRQAHFLLTLTHRAALNVLPNVRGNRPVEAGGVRLARDSGEAAARQAYGACRSGSG
jgi:hypothetical protein